MPALRRDAELSGRKLRRGARLWTVADGPEAGTGIRLECGPNSCHRRHRRRLPRPVDDEPFPTGTVHLPAHIDGEWLKQLVAEQLVTVQTKRGFSRLEWQKLRERNEALDCRTYARAAAWIAGLDRWTDTKWIELENDLSGSPVQASQQSGEMRESTWLERHDKWL